MAHMDALKSTLFGSGAALTILVVGYKAGHYARAELNRRLTERVAPYGLHAEARWAHPQRGGAWVVEGVHLWDDAGHLSAHAGQVRVQSQAITVRDLNLSLHGSALELRHAFAGNQASQTSQTSGLDGTANTAHRDLRFENLSVAWQSGDARWSLDHAALELSRTLEASTIELQSEMAEAHVQLPADPHAPLRVSGRAEQFPYALVEGLWPSGHGFRMHEARFSPEGEVQFERAAGVSTLWGDVSRATWRGSVRAEGIGVQNDNLSARALGGMSLQISSEGTWDATQLELRATRIGLGELQADLNGRLQWGGTSRRPELALELSIPKVSCDALRLAVPSAMWTHLSDARLAGTFEFKGHLNTLGATDDATLQFDTRADCTFETVPASANPDRFRRAFSYTVVDQHGAATERRTGPRTESWTPLDEIPDAMRAALLTSEDGGFYEHHGISLSAIRRAALKDIHERAFVQGASTLSMQLAKNVYLARNKTLGRKAEELLLTTLLEHGMQKEELLELYINVVEFGPDTYGIRDAAMHYFGRTPRELSVAECFFLVSGLPAPKRLEAARERGAPSPALHAHIGFLLRTAHKRGHIDADDVGRASRETLVFWRPGMPPPQPHDAWAEDPTSTGGVEAGDETGAYP